MAEQSLGNRTQKVKEPKYSDINEIPIGEIINAKNAEQKEVEQVEREEVEQDLKKTVIDINQVVDLLGSNTGSGVYEISFPSIGKTYQFNGKSTGNTQY